MPTAKRKIAVVTSTRADYGLLRNLIRRIDDSVDLKLQLFVTGTHLLSAFGKTVSEIEADGFTPHARVRINMSEDDSSGGMAKAVAQTITGFVPVFEHFQPDIVVVLGDRFEILAVAQTALLLNIPIAHIHGGEVTVGAVDDAIRHAITKMSHLHFVAAKEYAQRVAQMGEIEEHVFHVGAPGLENLSTLELMTKSELEEDLGLALNDNIYLVTFHPETLSLTQQIHELKALAQALAKQKDASIIWTMPNADAGSRSLKWEVKEICARRANFHSFESLGARRYLSLMGLSAAVVGNSSSGIIEAPFLRVPTINIGGRQDGRLCAISIIDCQAKVADLVKALRKARSKGFRKKISRQRGLYGDGNTSEKIVAVLESTELKGLLRKGFVDQKN